MGHVTHVKGIVECMLELRLICSTTNCAYTLCCSHWCMRVWMRGEVCCGRWYICTTIQLTRANLLFTVPFSIWGREVHSGETNFRLMKQVDVYSGLGSLQQMFCSKFTTYNFGALMSILVNYKKSRCILSQWPRCPSPFNHIPSIFRFSTFSSGRSRSKRDLMGFIFCKNYTIWVYLNF